MKRIISVALIITLILAAFSGCGSDLKYALNVGGADITEGVYTYFLDYALTHRDELSLESDSLEGDIEDAAAQLVKRYVAVNSLWAQLGENMDYDLRDEAAVNTDERWDLFGKYYEKIGITKQDLYKIVKSETYVTAITKYYYGEDSKISPIKTKTLKEAFSKKYVGVKIIAASLTTVDTLGNTVKLSGTSLTSIQRYFDSMEAKANSGADIDELYIEYNTSHDLIGTDGLETYVFTKDNTQYGSDFFKKVSKLENNRATVIENDDTIYLVYRVDISSDDYEYFMTYKNDVLVELYSDKIDELIEKRCEDYEVEEKSRTVKRIYKRLNELLEDTASEQADE